MAPLFRFREILPRSFLVAHFPSWKSISGVYFLFTFAPPLSRDMALAFMMFHPSFPILIEHLLPHSLSPPYFSGSTPLSYQRRKSILSSYHLPARLSFSYQISPLKFTAVPCVVTKSNLYCRLISFPQLCLVSALLFA